MVALIGASGSGKSTMLRQIAGLSKADRLGGSVEALGCPVQCDGTLSRSVRAVRSGIGFVYQQFNIVNRLTVLPNVLAGALGRIPPWRGALQWFTREERSQRLRPCTALAWRSSLSSGQQRFPAGSSSGSPLREP
jgi:phosphonate transport system ATP-binding protein